MQPVHDHAACLAPAVALKAHLCDDVFTAEVEPVAKGARIYQPGDSSFALHRVVAGLVGLSVLGSDGDELCFCRAVETYFATALEPTELVSAPGERVVAALRERPELALDLIKVLSDRLASAYAELLAVAVDPLIIRLARKLFDLCAATDGDGWCRLPRRFTHDELAHLLGVRRESLTRAMIDLRSLGLIDYGPYEPLRVASAAVRRFTHQTRRLELLPSTCQAGIDVR